MLEAGEDLAWFFEVYARRGPLPVLEVTATPPLQGLRPVAPRRLPARTRWVVGGLVLLIVMAAALLSQAPALWDLPVAALLAAAWPEAGDGLSMAPGHGHAVEEGS